MFAQIGCCVGAPIEPRSTRDLAVPIDLRGSPFAHACDAEWLATQSEQCQLDADDAQQAQCTGGACRVRASAAPAPTWR
ncbi:hypothetical protein XB05_02950 [Xanthomonas arboricola]|nr:hypothetical protein XB05_02950 [Xanthomonas arboricola]